MLLFIKKLQDVCWIKIYFNTSHVTVYPLHQSGNPCRLLISIHLMLLFIGDMETVKQTSHTFQYISCYCLSDFCCAVPYDIILFQYISCYCLSASLLRIQSEARHFNTSHVTVYHDYRKKDLL